MFENVFDIKNQPFPWTFSRKLRLKQLFRPQSYRMVQILPVGALKLQDCPPHVVYLPAVCKGVCRISNKVRQGKMVLISDLKAFFSSIYLSGALSFIQQ